MSDQLRTVIYRQFMADPAVNNVRSLAALYGLSLKRVDAILRLKGLEEHWMKVSTFTPLFEHIALFWDEYKSISLEETLHGLLVTTYTLVSDSSLRRRHVSQADSSPSRYIITSIILKVATNQWLYSFPYSRRSVFLPFNILR